MTSINDEIIKVFGNKLRVRVSGICMEGENILLVKHHSLGPKGILWAPPGGGVGFAESSESTLKREFLEETGLEIEVGKFLFVHEFLDPPLHAIELFFEVKRIKGNIIQGTDPEMAFDQQIIHEVKFFSFKEIQHMDLLTFHNIFSLSSDANNLLSLKGYFIHDNSGKKPKKS